MWVDGSLVGDPGSCYYGVFKSLIADQKTWIVGTMLMKEYYTIFDMSPYDEFNQDYIQIGFARKNPMNVVGDTRYDKDALFFSPLNKSMDSSHVIPPWNDSYPV